MSLLSFFITYFTSSVTLLTVLILYIPLAGLFLIFRLKRDDPELRSRILVSVFMTSTFNWSFLASSLLFCQALLGLYYRMGYAAVGTVFSLALITSLAAALPFSVFVSRNIPSILMKRLAGGLSEASRAVESIFKRNAERLGLSSARLAQSSSRAPFAYTIGGRDTMIVVSKGLVELLDGDEMETVLAHELAHVKDGDMWVKMLVSVYRRVLFFDPLLRFIEAALHREKELLADDFSARLTRKPLSLASALLKIHSASSKMLAGYISGLSITGKGGFLRRAPSLKERIERLLKIAEELREGSTQLIDLGR